MMMKKEVLAAFFLVVLLGSGAILSPALASPNTEEEKQAIESNDDAPSTEETNEEKEPETPTEPEPEPEDKTTPPPPVVEETPPVKDEKPIECSEGFVLEDDKCVAAAAAAEQLPLESPSPELECPPGQFPAGEGENQACVDCEGPCPEEPPANPGPDGDCLFDPSLPKCASDNGECPDGFFQNEDGNCFPQHDRCPKGYHSHEDDETGRCIPNSEPCEDGYIISPDFPECMKKQSVCRDHPELKVCGGEGKESRRHHNDKDITIVINKIIKETNEGKHHDGFPDVDIIGLSTKKNGDSMVCLMNIDKDDVQCQDFGMPEDRVNGEFWRIIETDHDKDYDDGNTGSNDIDRVIDDIKSQDFSELDDATNHDFDVDLVWVAINPQGDGFTCLSEDSTGKGKSLCEPFQVSNKDVSGQITEGVSMN